MKKILWLSNCLFSDGKINTSGTWIYAMAKKLIKTKLYKIYNITQSNVRAFQQQEFDNLTQWVIPIQKLNKDGLPSNETIQIINDIKRKVVPDLIHVWGTESFWGMLFVDKLHSNKTLLEIQGILSSIIDVYYGGLSISEIKKCRGLKEYVFSKMYLKHRREKLILNAEHEDKIIKSFDNISVQSNWVKTQIIQKNNNAKIHDVKIILRDEFISNQWNYRDSKKPVLFTSSSTAVPYKGLHVLFYALSHLVKTFPSIKLKIAGGVNPKKLSIFKDGYTKWLIALTKQLGIEESIEWLGSLDADSIVNEMLTSDVNVVPSFVESYSLAAAESLYLGLPTVVSNAGALPELGVHDESILIFESSNSVSCAHQIKRVLCNENLSKTLSTNSKKLATQRNNVDLAVNTQIKIYNKIIQ